MNTVILTILLISFLNNVSSITSICGARFKNSYLKLILLSDKRNIKILFVITNQCQLSVKEYMIIIAYLKMKKLYLKQLFRYAINL